jgi:tetratricopeptide (TPR) repeat protein
VPPPRAFPLPCPGPRASWRRAAVAAAILVACLPSPRVHPRVVEEVARGYEHLSRDDLERAEVAFAHALEFNPDVPEALNGAGLVERRRGRLEAARRRFARALEVAPDFAEGHVNLAELELAQGRSELAEEGFRAALRIDPDLPVARLDLARTLLHRGRADPAGRDTLWAAARREYLHLLESRPDLAEAHHDLGYMDYEAGRHARALEEYRRAAELAPRSVEALHGACVAAARLRLCEEAAAACRRCLEVAPAAAPCGQSLRALARCGAR